MSESVKPDGVGREADAGARADRAPRLLVAACWSLAASLGLLQLFGGYYFMDPDGLSYLDLGDALLAGNWREALNAYWSPLYPALLAATSSLLRPSAYWEFTAAHAVNYAAFLGSIACFEFCLRELWECGRTHGGETHGSCERAGLPRWAWWTFGYAFFLWSSVALIGVTWPTPDMLVGACVYLAAGLTLRARRVPAGAGTSLALGAVLGLGYLAKTAMLPVGLAFLAVNLWPLRPLRASLVRASLTAFVFALLALPLVAGLSYNKGRLTFGDSGRLNYSWSVNGTRIWMHWQGGSADSGSPVHPTRKLLDAPEVYEFAGPVGGTFPPWYDPTYWYEGVRVYFRPGQQARAVLRGGGVYLGMFFQDGVGRLLTASLLLLVLLGGGFGAREALKRWQVVVPALFAALMYALVVVVPRYVSPFAVLLLLALLSGVRLPRRQLAARGMRYASAVLPLLLLCGAALGPAGEAYATARKLAAGEEPHRHWLIARAVREAGVGEGDRVASVNYAFFPFWARLARAKVVAELPNATYATQDFNFVGGEAHRIWSDPAMNERVLGAFARAGARVVVARKVWDGTEPGEWKRVEGTDAYVCVVPTPSVAAKNERGER